jgi:hypothetical protein
MSARTEVLGNTGLAAGTNSGRPLMADSTAADWCIISSSATTSLPLPAAKRNEGKEEGN